MNTFVNAVQNSLDNAEARTANGMKARKTSANAVVDLFGQIGSSRGKDVSHLFAAALAENVDQTLRVLLWTRDIRGGSGERQTFRNLLANLEKQNPTLAGSIMHKIVELGRWDDLFSYQDPINKIKAYSMIRDALANRDSLCAKWAPRKGSIAVELTKFLGLTPKQYRKLLVYLTNVVESKMCAKTWSEINFSHVPSVASARYQKAFGRNAPIEYSKYITELQKPEAERDPKVKINAGAVYPYDVIRSVSRGNEAVANEQWKALPNYVGDNKILPMVDVSDSMGSIGFYSSGSPRPIEVAVSLGLYLSDKNTSAFKDVFLTFSGTPELIQVHGTLSQKMKQMNASKWQMNTNLHAAFGSVLDLAVSHNVDPKDMPSVILILSDMQFDSCTKHDDSAMEMINRKYEKAGYEVPKIVFWNLNTYGNTPVKFDEKGTCHVSGFSPSIMKSILSNDLEEYTPYNVMIQTIMNERYNYVV